MRFVREMLYAVGLLILVGVQGYCQDVNWQFTAPGKEEVKKPKMYKNSKDARETAVFHKKPMIGWNGMSPDKHPELSGLDAIHYKIDDSPLKFPCLVISGAKDDDFILREEKIGEDAVKKIKEVWGVPSATPSPSRIGEDLSKKGSGNTGNGTGLPETVVKATICSTNQWERVEMARGIGKPVIFYVDVYPSKGSEVEKFFEEFGDAENLLIGGEISNVGKDLGPRIVFRNKNGDDGYILVAKMKDGKDMAKKVREIWNGWTDPTPSTTK